MPYTDFNTPMMDAPDLMQRRAALKAQMGQPLSNLELDRLGTRLMDERDAATGRSAPNSALGRSNYDFNGRATTATPALAAPADYSVGSVLAGRRFEELDPAAPLDRLRKGQNNNKDALTTRPIDLFQRRP